MCLLKEDEFLKKIISREAVIKNYNPYTVDPIKWSEEFNRNYQTKTQEKYLTTWSHLLVNNFEGYVKSYLLFTYDLWTVNKFNPIQSRFFDIDTNSYSGNMFKNAAREKILPDKLQNLLELFYTKWTVYFNNGFCFIILLLISTYILNSKRKDLVLLSLPLLGVWITLMLSAPISYALRYMSPYIYIVPFILLITIQELNIEKFKLNDCS